MTKTERLQVVIHELHDLQAASDGAMIDCWWSICACSTGALYVSLIITSLDRLRWKTRSERAENNRINECVGNAILIPGILTLPNLLANPPSNPEGSIKFRISSLYRGYHPSREPNSSRHCELSDGCNSHAFDLTARLK